MCDFFAYSSAVFARQTTAFHQQARLYDSQKNRVHAAFSLFEPEYQTGNLVIYSTVNIPDCGIDLGL